jgi:hypothetical protein
MTPDRMDSPLALRRRFRWPLYAGLGGAAGLLTIGAFVVADAGIWPAEKPPVAENEPSPPKEESGAGLVSHIPPPEEPAPLPKRLADAFEAATGRRDGFNGTDENNYAVWTGPLKLVDLPFGPVLLVERDLAAGHAQTGSIGVYYLRESARRFEVTGRWPKAVEGWDWGDPPSTWELTDRFTAYPAIYATGDYMGQGIILQGATLTELRPDGPATSDLIGTSYDDDGSRFPESKPSCVVKGRIANIRRDRSFDVVVTGSVNAVDRYVKRNGRFVARRGIDWDEPCFQPAEEAG